MTTLIPESIIKSCEDMLNQLDTNKDGRISYDEVVNSYLNIATHEQAHMMADALFDNIDTNRDHVITKREIQNKMLSSYVKKKEQEVKRDTERLLKKFDTDKDKSISFEEVLDILGNESDPFKSARTIFSCIDKDKNGVITIQEIKTYYSKMHNLNPAQ